MAMAPERLGPKTSKLLQTADNLAYSSISIAEINIKAMLGKLKVNGSLRDLAEANQISELHFDALAADEITQFSALIRHDPFDRMILATAKAKNAILVTSDQTLLSLELDWIQDASL